MLMTTRSITRETGACIECKHCKRYSAKESIDHSTRFSCIRAEVAGHKEELDQETMNFFASCNEKIGAGTVTDEEVEKILSRDTVICGVARKSAYCKFEWHSEKKKKRHQKQWDEDRKEKVE